MLGNGGLRFSQAAWLKIQWFLHCGSTEFSCMGISDKDDPMLVEDVYVPKHYASTAFVEFDSDDLNAQQFKLLENGMENDRFARIWIHTHPDKSATPSGPDWDTFRRVYGKTDWSCMVIFARGGEMTARLRVMTTPEYHPHQQSLACEADIKIHVVGDMLPDQSSAWMTINDVPRDILCQLPLQEWTDLWEENCRPWSENPDQTSNVVQTNTTRNWDTPPTPSLYSNQWLFPTRSVNVDNLLIHRVMVPHGLPNDVEKLLEAYATGILSKNLEQREATFEQMLNAITTPLRAKEHAVCVWRYVERMFGVFASKPLQPPKKGRAPNTAGTETTPYPIGTLESAEEVAELLTYLGKDTAGKSLNYRCGWRLACRYCLTHMETENAVAWNNSAEYLAWIETCEMEFGEFYPGFGMFTDKHQAALMAKWDKKPYPKPPRNTAYYSSSTHNKWQGHGGYGLGDGD